MMRSGKCELEPLDLHLCRWRRHNVEVPSAPTKNATDRQYHVRNQQDQNALTVTF